MTNEERDQMKKKLHNTIREWNQAEEFGESAWADKLMKQIKRMEAILYPEAEV